MGHLALTKLQTHSLRAQRGCDQLGRTHFQVPRGRFWPSPESIKYISEDCLQDHASAPTSWRRSQGKSGVSKRDPGPNLQWSGRVGNLILSGFLVLQHFLRHKKKTAYFEKQQLKTVSGRYRRNARYHLYAETEVFFCRLQPWITQLNGPAYCTETFQLVNQLTGQGPPTHLLLTTN